MNKAKIINLAVGLVGDTQKALMMRDQSLLQYCKDCEKQIIEEVNSKIKMPKVFDEWDCEEHECCDCCEMEIENLISMYFKNDLASYNGRMLLKWINQGEFKDNMSRLLKCIDAIRYGYEVEK